SNGIDAREDGDGGGSGKARGATGAAAAVPGCVRRGSRVKKAIAYLGDDDPKPPGRSRDDAGGGVRRQRGRGRSPRVAADRSSGDDIGSESSEKAVSGNEDKPRLPGNPRATAGSDGGRDNSGGCIGAVRGDDEASLRQQLQQRERER
ncbi:unnamed protein product, partial [Ectocarpus fasciculatus]